MHSNAAWSSSFRKSLAPVGAIQHVIDLTTLDRTGASGHELSLRLGALHVKKNTPVPFSIRVPLSPRGELRRFIPALKRVIKKRAEESPRHFITMPRTPLL
jgi:hypothetical protein